jgi:phytoene dehydrogenase-like protein
LLLLVAFVHDYGIGYCKGGSGNLAAALVRSIEDRGGEIRTSSPVKQFKVSGGRAVGVILEDGEEILASKAVVTNFNIIQLDAAMLGTSDLPEEYLHNIKVMRMPGFQPFHQGLALHEAPCYKAGTEADWTSSIEFLPDTEEDLNKIWDDFNNGIPHVDIPLAIPVTRWDPTQAPAGKHTLYLYHYNPYNLKGGAHRWDEIKQEIADKILEYLASRCTNMDSKNIIGRWASSPLDFERNNRAWYQGNFCHIGGQISQNFGLRPFPLVSNYRLPVDKLYICGPSTHPGPGITGGGRAAVVVIMDDMGINFDDVITGSLA